MLIVRVPPPHTHTHTQFSVPVPCMLTVSPLAFSVPADCMLTVSRMVVHEWLCSIFDATRGATNKFSKQTMLTCIFPNKSKVSNSERKLPTSILLLTGCVCSESLFRNRIKIPKSLDLWKICCGIDKRPLNEDPQITFCWAHQTGPHLGAQT